MTEQNQTPDVTTEDDTEGHGFRHRDDSDDDAATLAFLDRRLAGVAGIGKLRRRLARPFTRCRQAAA